MEFYFEIGLSEISVRFLRDNDSILLAVRSTYRHMACQTVVIEIITKPLPKLTGFLMCFPVSFSRYFEAALLHDVLTSEFLALFRSGRCAA
jgi:hypothetical protein